MSRHEFDGISARAPCGMSDRRGLRAPFASDHLLPSNLEDKT